jgi:hypothetical protein
MSIYVENHFRTISDKEPVIIYGGGGGGGKAPKMKELNKILSAWKTKLLKRVG